MAFDLISQITGIDLNYAKMEAFASIRRVAPLKNRVKSAIVATQPVHYGFARMFQMLNDNPKIALQIFADMESAMAWLAPVAAPVPAS